MDRLRFHLNDRLVEERQVSPTTTLLNYVRQKGLTGTKEGCAEGDCGACTVALLDADGPGGPRFRAVNGCLLFLPMLQGRRVYTVEALEEGGRPHAVQEALVQALGSQCGYCTPGVVMSMFEACYRSDLAEPWQIDDQMCGNLCRCTGYRPIREATARIAGLRPEDRFAERLRSTTPEPMALAYAAPSPGPDSVEQRYHNPTSLEELLALFAERPTARLVAGGTDLALEVTKKFRVLKDVISLEGVAELRRIERTGNGDGGGWRIGAAATLTEVQERLEGSVPALEKMLRFFASRQIRNRATVGGNLCTASPIGDLAPVLLALGARVELASQAGRRTLPLDDLFLAYRKTALGPGEVLAAILVPDLPAGARASAFKVSKRRELDISAVSAGMFVRLDAAGGVAEVRLAYGGVAATPARARRTEAALLGQPWTRASVEAAMPLLDEDFRPIDDHRGSAWFRARVARNLLLGFFLETQGGRAPVIIGKPTATVHLPEVSR